ncbi:MAG: hypothetical protein ACRBCJ_04935 [Hyphomicrobiaceae bacterium]
MRITLSIIFICYGWIGAALSADPRAARVGVPSIKRIVVKLDPDVPVVIATINRRATFEPTYQLAANIPEKNDLDTSLMGEDRIPADGDVDAPPVYEGPDNSPSQIDDETYELPPSAEDAYLPQTRPKTKRKAKSKRKSKRKWRHKTMRRKHKVYSKKRTWSKRKKATIANKTTTKRSKSLCRLTYIFDCKRQHHRRSKRAHTGYSALGVSTKRHRRNAHIVKRKSYRKQRLQEYKAYTSHIMPFGY